MSDVTLAEKITAVEQAIARRDEWIAAYGLHAERDAGILEAALADLRAQQAWEDGTAKSSLSYRAGAIGMRERAANVPPHLKRDVIGARDGSSIASALDLCERAIRALPVE